MTLLVLDQILNTVFHKALFWGALFNECEENDIANYADDTTPYSCGTDIPTVISELQGISAKVFS